MAGETYTVAQGDTMITIAKKKELRSWEWIWNHPQNAALRGKRPDPQVLAPGDQVFIPPKKPKDFQVDTGKKHVFRVKSLKAKLRVSLSDENGGSLSGKKFKLEVGGKTIEGQTTGDSAVELDIDPEPAKGKLTVWMGTDPEKELTWNLDLGRIDPIELLSGVQARLNNLGFLSGPVDGELDDDLKSALTQFQILHGLDPSGAADDDTKAKLVALHDRK